MQKLEQIINILKVQVSKDTLVGPIKRAAGNADRWSSNWIEVDSWSKYRGFCAEAHAGNAVGGVCYGTLNNGVISYIQSSPYVSVSIDGNKIRGSQGIMSNVGVFLIIF